MYWCAGGGFNLHAAIGNKKGVRSRATRFLARSLAREGDNLKDEGTTYTVARSLERARVEIEYHEQARVWASWR